MPISPTKQLFPNWRGDEPYEARAQEVRRQLYDSFPDLTAAVAAAPFERFEDIQAGQPPMAGYTHVSARLAAFMDGVPARLREAYLCALLLWHIGRFEEAFASSGLDPEFRLQAIDSIHRILGQIEGGVDWADIHRDSYMKDLGIVRLSVLAAVGQLIYPHAGIWRSKVLKGGPRAIWHVYVRCGGAAPFLEIHTHDPMVKDYFNPAGWEETYRLTAKAFRTFPESRGLIGTSWFYDPQLEDISPRLSYLRHVPLSKGAFFLPVGTSQSSIALATATSPTRRRLYEEGRYIPNAHALLWARKDILAHYG